MSVNRRREDVGSHKRKLLNDNVGGVIALGTDHPQGTDIKPKTSGLRNADKAHHLAEKGKNGVEPKGWRFGCATERPRAHCNRIADEAFNHQRERVRETTALTRIEQLEGADVPSRQTKRLDESVKPELRRETTASTKVS